MKRQRKWIPLQLILSFILFFCGCQGKQVTIEQPPKKLIDTTQTVDLSETGSIAIPPNNTLSTQEQAEGWSLLFDGKTTSGWHVYGDKAVKGWQVDDGELIAMGASGEEGMATDIVTNETYENFELKLEWKMSSGGNSGIFFNVVENSKFKAVWETGPEYQLIDDETFPQELEGWQKSAANYAMHPPKEKAYKPLGEWNSTRLKVENGVVEHWLNDKSMVRYELWTPEWQKLVAASKWKDYPNYGKAKKGLIALQDHGNQIWFRNIKVRGL